MVNPSVNDAQAFDDGAPGYDDSLALALPHDAGGGESIIKAVSLAGGCNKSCLQTAAVLTVLDTAPPATALRPAYFGAAATKLLYCTDSLSLKALPVKSPLGILTGRDNFTLMGVATSASVGAGVHGPIMRSTSICGPESWPHT